MLTVLRTDDGTRVFDADDVPALLALAELAALLDRRWSRGTAVGELPSTAVERHRRETGHALRFGCCRLSDARSRDPWSLDGDAGLPPDEAA